MNDIPPRETLIEIGETNAVMVSTVDGRVSVDWHGPRHAELTTGEARALGYVLRGYAGMISDDTGE